MPAPKFTKSPPKLIAAFTAIVPKSPDVVQRTMFGYPCAFARGNMFCGLFGDGLFVRLGEDDREKLLAERGAKPFAPMPTRPMKEYVVVPPAMIADTAKLRTWVRRSLAYAKTLRPK